MVPSPSASLAMSAARNRNILASRPSRLSPANTKSISLTASEREQRPKTAAKIEVHRTWQASLGICRPHFQALEGGPHSRAFNQRLGILTSRWPMSTSLKSSRYFKPVNPITSPPTPSSTSLFLDTVRANLGAKRRDSCYRVLGSRLVNSSATSPGVCGRLLGSRIRSRATKSSRRG